MSSSQNTTTTNNNKKPLNATAPAFTPRNPHPTASPSSQTTGTRSRSSTNPSEFNTPINHHHQPGANSRPLLPLEEVFRTANTTYQRDIQRLCLCPDSRRSSLLTAHAPADAAPDPNYYRAQGYYRAGAILEQMTTSSLPLPAPCVEMEEAWRDGGRRIKEAIVALASGSTSPRERW